MFRQGTLDKRYCLAQNCSISTANTFNILINRKLLSLLSSCFRKKMRVYTRGLLYATVDRDRTTGFLFVIHSIRVLPLKSKKGARQYLTPSLRNVYINSLFCRLFNVCSQHQNNFGVKRVIYININCFSNLALISS